MYLGTLPYVCYTGTESLFFKKKISCEGMTENSVAAGGSHGVEGG